MAPAAMPMRKPYGASPWGISARLLLLIGLAVIFSPLTFSTPGGSSSDSGGPRQPGRHMVSVDVPETTITEEQRAAVLRLPPKDNAAPATKKYTEPASASNLDDAIELDAERRRALRLPEPSAAAKRAREWKDEEDVRRIIEINGDPDEMGPFMSAVYKVACAWVMWIWIMNIMTFMARHA
mmetsp:Transcript_123810/g.309489  ORF Transcript_123810/g.309489 Transcript_123810/m.309489 type:complete len:181 (-) Transcript_123810:66-608(-)